MFRTTKTNRSCCLQSNRNKRLVYDRILVGSCCSLTYIFLIRKYPVSIIRLDFQGVRDVSVIAGGAVANSVFCTLMPYRLNVNQIHSKPPTLLFLIGQIVLVVGINSFLLLDYVSNFYRSSLSDVKRKKLH